MMLNLFIAVVLEGFSSANKDFTSAVTNEDYKNFLDTLNYVYDDKNN